MISNRLGKIVFGVLAAAALVAMPRVAAADSLPFSYNVQNPCTGHIVNIVGTAIMTASVTFDNGGGTHLTATSTAAGTAADLTDASVTYSYSESDSIKANFNAAGGGETRFAQNFVLAGATKADTWKFKILVHVVVDAVGNIKSEIDNTLPIQVQCKSN